MAFLPSSSIFQRLLSASSRSLAHTRWMSTACMSVIPPSKTHNSSSPSPWLMLPPSFDDDTTSIGYNFYSLAEKKVLTLPQTEGLNHLRPNPIHDFNFCGSSHGWIGLFNPQTLDMFIYNPISLRHIKLPPVQNLPNYPVVNQRSVTKLILSCSPDDNEQSCLAMIMYNCVHALAFCFPGHSDEWTQIGIFPSRNAQGKRVGNCYNDIAYSSRKKLLFGITDFSDVETWDLSDPSSPRLIKTINMYDDKYYSDPSQPSWYDDLEAWPDTVEYLVVVDDDVFLATRYVMNLVTPDGSCVEREWEEGSVCYPFFRMTVDFGIDVYDHEKDEFRPGLPSLGDLALFIGSCSDSVALSTTLFSELKSNSIYFTDRYMVTRDMDHRVFGGQDIGIFDFENETVSRCYYPCDRPNVKRIVPSPIWFFPRL